MNVVADPDTVRLLAVEDSEADFHLTARHLRSGFPAIQCERVDSRATLEAALAAGGWHVVLSDYSMPGLSFREVLALVREHAPDLPVILLSGNVGEEEAVELLKLGVSDFVVKDRPARLLPAIRNSLREAVERRAWQAAEAALRDSEERNRLALDAARLGAWRFDPSIGRVEIDVRCREHLRIDAPACSIAELTERVHPDDRARYADFLATLLDPAAASARSEIDVRHLHPDGSVRWFAITARTHFEGEGAARRARFVTGTCQDITERRAAEDALRERVELQARLESVARTVPGVIHSFRRRPDGHLSVPFASDALGHVFQLHRDELAADAGPLFARVHPDDRDALHAAIEESARGMTPWRGEFRIRRDDGTVRWLEGHSVPLREPDGGVLWHGFIQDVTERKTVEAARDEALHALAQAQAMARVGSWSCELPGATITVSPELARFYGVEGGVVDAAMSWTHIHPDDRPDVLSAWRRALKGAPYDVEHRIVVEGRVKWVHAKAEVVFAPDGRAVSALGITQDITEAREAQAALDTYRRHLEQEVAARTAEVREQASYLYALIDNVPFQVWFKDTDSRYLAVNRANAAACGLAIEEMVGHTDDELWPGQVARELRESDAAVRESRRPRTGEEHAEGAEGSVWVETYNAPVFDDQGAVIGTVGFARDITDRKLTEQAREAALAEARRLAQVRSDFLANMSHEIRTPLNAVLGLAQAGARDVATRDVHPAFNRILDAGRMLLGVVDDILDFSKIEAGKLELESAEFRVGDVIDRAIALFAPRAAAKGLDLRIEESAGLPDTLSGDALRLSQILVNLLSNAVKFTEHGTVSLLVEAEPGGLHVAVEDSGIGMSALQLDRLFQPFEQADGSTTRRFGGTGLGLAISKRLLDLMHGTIDVASRVGGGARFDLHIPFADGRAAEPVLPRRIALAGLPADETVRITDALQARGMTVTVPDDAAPTAVAPDLVVVDLAALERVAAVVEPAVRIAVVCPPGVAADPLESWRDRVVVLERPLRVRHVLEALDAGVSGVASAPDHARLAGLRVLAAEDNEVNRVVLQELLELEGAQLVQAANGRLAVERFVADGPGAYDVVLTDIQMPEMDGYETTRRLHAIAPGLPVIGLTAHAMSEERDRCLAAGMVEHVAKPIDLDRLVAVLRPYVPLRGGVFAAAPVVDVPSVPAPVEPVAGETQPALEATSAGPVDWPGLMIRFKGRREFVDKLASIVVKTHRDTPSRLRESSAQGDLDAIAFTAHSLKGMGGNLMATSLRHLATRTEDAARRGDSDTPALAIQLAGVLELTLSALTAGNP